MPSFKTKRDTEWEWYATRTGVSYPTNARLSDMHKIYWAKTLGVDSNKITSADLQVRWLHSLTGVGTTNKCISDLWRDAVMGLGQKPTDRIEENKWLYYTFAS